MKSLMETSKRVLRGLSEADGSDTKYDKVYREVAKHFDLDPENIDNKDQDTKKKFFDTLDKCYDENEDEVPDACPVDSLKNKEE